MTINIIYDIITSNEYVFQYLSVLLEKLQMDWWNVLFVVS